MCSCVQGPLIAGVTSKQGAAGLPYYCTPPVCVPDVLGALAVWRQTKKKKCSEVSARR